MGLGEGEEPSGCFYSWQGKHLQDRYRGKAPTQECSQGMNELPVLSDFILWCADGGRVGRAKGLGRDERGVFDWGGWEERVDGRGWGQVVRGRGEWLGRRM